MAALTAFKAVALVYDATDGLGRDKDMTVRPFSLEP